MSKHLWIEAYEELRAEYLDANPQATDDEAERYAEDRADERAAERLAEEIDDARDRAKYST